MTNYLYNGVELSDIYSVYTPELQKLYPHVCIASPNIIGTSYYLYATAQPVWGAGVFSLNAPYARAKYADGVWGEFTETTGSGVYGLQKMYWANYDVLTVDGAVYLPASEPIPVTPAEPINPTAMLMGWLMGERIAGMRGKQQAEPVAYLYNGVPLPDIYKVYTPELQKTHPFAVITGLKVLSRVQYTLHLYQTLFVARDENYSDDNWSLLAYGDYLTATIYSTNTEWPDLEIKSKTNIVGKVEVNGELVPYSYRLCNYDSDFVFWSNYSFPGPNGEEWVTASDPVPVYE